MTDHQYADLINAKLDAKVEHEADPASDEKYNAYIALCRAHRQALNSRQVTAFRQQYPPVNFERIPDEGLL
jgi:hypothetical protein